MFDQTTPEAMRYLQRVVDEVLAVLFDGRRQSCHGLVLNNLVSCSGFKQLLAKFQVACQCLFDAVDQQEAQPEAESAAAKANGKAHVCVQASIFADCIDEQHSECIWVLVPPHASQFILKSHDCMMDLIVTYVPGFLCPPSAKAQQLWFCASKLCWPLVARFFCAYQQLEESEDVPCQAVHLCPFGRSKETSKQSSDQQSWVSKQG